MKAEFVNLMGHDIFVRYRIKETVSPVLLYTGWVNPEMFSTYGSCLISVIVPDLLGYGKSER
jgi:hypothetical protein